MLEKEYLPLRILQRELKVRKEKNSSYSIRALARDLGISATALSDVLAKKRKLSRKNILKLEEKIPLSYFEKESLKIQQVIKRSHKKLDLQEIEGELIKRLGDWFFFAILNLSKLKDCQASPQWIANRLGIEVDQALDAVFTLKELDLIAEKDGKLMRTSKDLTTKRNIPNSTVRNLHRDHLKLAEAKLDNVPMEQRDFSSVVMAIDPQYIPKAREIIMKAKRRVAKLLEKPTANEVYALCFQLFPLTKTEITED